MSESENLPGKGEMEMVVETFVDRMEEIYPNLDREEFHEAISGYVREAVEQDGDDEEEESEEE